jgi:low temperature requirement protein LtrA
VKAGAALAIAATAIEIPRVLEGDGGSMVFAIGYAVARVLLVALYVRTRFHVREQGRKLLDIYIAAFSFTSALWVISIFVPGDGRFVLWGLALAIDLCVPPFTWRTLGSTPIVVSHLTERFGVFFIVVLGLSVAEVVSAVAGFQFSAEAWVIAGSCFFISLCLWWIYFDLADTSVVGRGTLGLVFPYGHLPLFPGVGAFAAGTTLAITHADHASLEPGARWALCGGIAAFVLGLAIIHIGAEWTSLRDRAFLGRLVLIGFLIVLAATGGGIDPLAFVLVITAAVFGQLLLEAFTFPTGAASILEPPEQAAESAIP